MGLSLKSKDQEAGGFLDDVDVTAKEHRFEMFDYDGQIDDPVPALKVTFETEDGEEREQYFSAGSKEKVKPSKDGKRLEPAGESKAAGLNRNTKAAHFLKSYIASGFDEDKVEDDVSVFDGVRVHVNQKPWKGYNAKEGDTILLATKVLGEAKGAKSDAKGKAKSGGKSGLIDKTDKAILALLEDAPKGKIEKAKISTLLFKANRKDEDVKAMTEMSLDDDYLAGDDRPFDYDGDTIIKK